ncbi:isoflavone reductase family [Fusarium denticulatum]|uniref:Isoflavone reductase family n=1 Tax=Fusarium denticulatum TaxID=48507 RepID=A0A8H5TEX6_9HYPO|nr:isoflavone reductase family [Fusarium denticulatum]
MAQIFRNVALAGATGKVGSNILQALVERNCFNVTILARQESHAIPSGVIVKIVDFDSASSLVEALQGQDAVIDATSIPDPAVSIRLIDAAVAAGVARFIPSEFTADPNNAQARALPIFQGKAYVYGHLQKLSGDGKITWTAVSSGALLDCSLRTSFVNIDLVNKKVDLMNDGSIVFPWTLLSSVGQAVASILMQPTKTKNRVCFVSNIQKSQKDMAELAKEALGHEGWQEGRLDMDEVLQEAMSELQRGNFNFKVIGDIIRYSISAPGYVSFPEKDDSELLNIKTLDDAAIKQLIEEIATEKN